MGCGGEQKRGRRANAFGYLAEGGGDVYSPDDSGRLGLSPCTSISKRG